MARQPRQQGFCRPSFHACLGPGNATAALPYHIPPRRRLSGAGRLVNASLLTMAAAGSEAGTLEVLEEGGLRKVREDVQTTQRRAPAQPAEEGQPPCCRRLASRHRLCSCLCHHLPCPTVDRRLHLAGNRVWRAPQLRLHVFRGGVPQQRCGEGQQPFSRLCRQNPLVTSGCSCCCYI
jgi:hypothetical protein